VCRFHGGASPQAKQKAQERLLALEPRAVRVLGTLLDRDDAPHVQLAAVKDVLDRTMGKAPQAVDVSGPASGPIEFRWAGDAPWRTTPEPDTTASASEPPQLPPPQEAHTGEDGAMPVTSEKLAFQIPTHLPPVPAGWRKAPPRKP
jgi:hypothetical protein